MEDDEKGSRSVLGGGIRGEQQNCTQRKSAKSGRGPFTEGEGWQGKRKTPGGNKKVWGPLQKGGKKKTFSKGKKKVRAQVLIGG